jgi:hypothetical protein
VTLLCDNTVPPIRHRQTRGNPFVNAIGGWIGRIMTQPSMRRMG